MAVQIPVYLDNAATTRVDPRVAEKMIPYLEKMEMNNERTHLFLRHTLGLFHNVKGSKYWKNSISSQNLKNNKGSLIIREILKNSKECEI